MKAADVVICYRFIRQCDNYCEIVSEQGIIAMKDTLDDAIAFCEERSLSYYIN